MGVGIAMLVAGPKLPRTRNDPECISFLLVCTFLLLSCLVAATLAGVVASSFLTSSKQHCFADIHAVACLVALLYCSLSWGKMTPIIVGRRVQPPYGFDKP